MEDSLTKLLECNDNFRKHIKDFIEIFVEYYGEEERTYIEEQFNSALLVGYLSEYYFEYVIQQLEELESNRLYKELMAKTSLSVTKEQLFGINYSFEYDSLHPISKYERYYEQFLLGREGINEKGYKMKKKEAVEFLKTIDSSITLDNLEEKTPQLTEINSLLNDYKSAKNKYTLFKKQYAKYYNIIKHNKDLKHELQEK